MKSGPRRTLGEAQICYDEPEKAGELELEELHFASPYHHIFFFQPPIRPLTLGVRWFFDSLKPPVGGFFLWRRRRSFRSEGEP